MDRSANHRPSLNAARSASSHSGRLGCRASEAGRSAEAPTRTRTMNKAFVALLAFVTIVTCLISCSKASPFVGKWQEIAGDNETLEFSKSGSFSLVSKGRTLDGKYSDLENGRIKLELGGTGAATRPAILYVALSGEELTVTDPFGRVSKYARGK